MPSTTTPVADARTIFGDAFLGPEDVARALGITPAAFTAERPALLTEVPFDREALHAARARDELLVFRASTDGTAPLTLLRLLERFPDAVEAKLFKGVGYLLKDEWTLDQEPFAATATCPLEWRLVHRAPIACTRNLPYERQDEALAGYARAIGLGGRLRRRSAVAIVYDTILFQRARGLRLLERDWDWSDTPTLDGGYVTAGGFGPAGLHVLGYSRAVRFGTLGVCAQH